jgi:histidinol dehydrogenase
MLTYFEYSQLTIEDKKRLVSRNSDSDHTIQKQVEEIIAEVKDKGDQALKSYSEKFDKVSLDSLIINEDEINQQAETVDRNQKRALEIAFNNIYMFHRYQLVKEKRVETTSGVNCWRENRPIERVGLYIPGGTAVLPSTFLMLAVPARIAGCKEIVVCSPPQPDGKINPYIAYCAQLLKIDRIFSAGGAQAIAAMAYGTESIPKVDKIFGPGNQYVTQAKTLVQLNARVAIDIPAGPSEVIVIGDETSNPIFVAADLLAQAEHGKDSQAILLSTNESLIEKVQEELKKQIEVLPRAEIAKKAIENSYAILFEAKEDLMVFCNDYAPEHLIVSVDEPEAYNRMIVNAGSVFYGHLTPESAGDYASGTNHTLPTSAHAKAYSGVSVDSFIKKITFQQINEDGILNLGPTIEILAEIEGLQAHKNAVSVRLEYLQSKNK